MKDLNDEFSDLQLKNNGLRLSHETLNTTKTNNYMNQAFGDEIVGIIHINDTLNLDNLPIVSRKESLEDDINFEFEYGYDYQAIIQERLKTVNAAFAKDSTPAEKKLPRVSFDVEVTAFTAATASTIINQDSSEIERNISDLDECSTVDDLSERKLKEARIPLNDTSSDAPQKSEEFSRRIKNVLFKYDNAINNGNNNINNHDDDLNKAFKYEDDCADDECQPSDDETRKSVTKIPNNKNTLKTSTSSIDSLNSNVIKTNSNKLSTNILPIVKSNSSVNASITNKYHNKNSNSIKKPSIINLSKSKLASLNNNNNQLKVTQEKALPALKNDSRVATKIAFEEKEFINDKSDEIDDEIDNENQNGKEKNKHEKVLVEKDGRFSYVNSDEYISIQKIQPNSNIFTIKPPQTNNKSSSVLVKLVTNNDKDSSQREKERNSEKAFEEWLRNKEKTKIEQLKKCEKTNKKDDNSREDYAKKAFDKWLETKHIQVIKEKEKQKKLEEIEKSYSTLKSSTDRENTIAFKQWLKKKYHEKQEAKRVATLEKRKWTNRFRKSLRYHRLSQAIEMAQIYGYTSYYYTTGFNH